MSESVERPRAILAELGIEAVTAVAPVTGGADTEIWRVEHGGTVSALRVFRSGQSDDAEIERLAMVAASVVLPVPEIRSSGIWTDRPVMLLEWMPGVPLLHAVVDNLENAAACGQLMGEAQAKLHGVAAPDGLPSAAESWLGHLEPDLPIDARGHQLLHFDFHPLNVMVSEGRVSGVIDWSNAAYGDPRLDAARSWALLEAVQITFPNLDAQASRVVMSEFSRGWRQAYEEARGPLLDVDPYFRWALSATRQDLAMISPDKPNINDIIAKLA